MPQSIEGTHAVVTAKECIYYSAFWIFTIKNNYSALIGTLYESTNVTGNFRNLYNYYKVTVNSNSVNSVCSNF